MFEPLLTWHGSVVMAHVIAKSTEMGGMLGVAVGVLAACVAGVATRGRKNPALVLLKTCELGVALGTVAGVGMMLAKAHKDVTMTDEGVRDRAYRLENSHTKLATKLDDRWLMGGVTGAVILAGGVPDSVLKEGDDDSTTMTLWDKLWRGFCLGGSISFALSGGALVLHKMLTKKLTMS